MKPVPPRILSIVAFLISVAAYAQAPKDEVHYPPTLYRGCVTKIDLKRLVENYKPGGLISIKGGKILANKNTNELPVVPDSTKVVLTVVTTNGSKTAVNLDVKHIPQAHFKCIVNGTELGRDAHISSLNTISIKPDTDESFLAYAPSDSRFVVKSIEVLIERDTSTVAKKIFTKPEIQASELADFQKAIKSGDKVMIAISKIYRINYLGKQEATSTREYFSAVYEKGK